MSKLILTQEVSGLGSAGDVVEVKNGYARNYLIPQGFAVAWSRGGEKQIESIKAARAAREHATIEEAQDLKARLEANPVTLTVTAGAEGRLFGSVKPGDVAAAVEAAGVGSIDKRLVELVAPVKSVGTHEAILKLRDGIVATITLNVVADKKKK
ncbi:MAG: 50S ribosomal protein L9 [Microcella sp.]